jgi:predicted cupin superfamily sugar epimerase
MHPRATELIAMLDLRPHPEGGFYREVFRSSAQITPADGRGRRAAVTTIYFLLPEGAVSRWHQVASDEVWHLYEGGPLELLELGETGDDLERHQLAPLEDGSGAPIHTVVAGRWQAARPLGSYVLVGCTVAPGFDFEDFRLLGDDPEYAAAIRAKWPAVASFV